MSQQPKPSHNQTSASPKLDLPFTPRLPPIEHQAEFLATSARAPYYALFWEQGTGKTKALIDNAALLACENEIDGTFVLAPNGVHRNWVVEELPIHWPHDAPAMIAFVWDVGRAGTQLHQQAYKAFLASAVPIKFLCMSYDAMLTTAGKKASWDFIRKRRAMIIGDESQRFKTPNAKRTKTIIAAGVYGVYNRIASGTPMDTPFDIYSQLRFLSPEIWMNDCGIGTYSAFKSYFGEWVKVTLAGGREFPKLKQYLRLEELERVVARVGSRVLKEDVLDLPQKSYKRVFHELSPSQRQAYEQLRAEALTFLESGELVTADMAMVLDIRLSQICCGFVRSEAGGPDLPFTPNPREAMLKEILLDLTRPAIIWGQFTQNVRMAVEASRAAGRRPVVFDGNHPELSIDPFHRGEYDDLIALTSSNMREGYTLNEADTTIYVSNSTKLLHRQQSEDRNHRIGQTRPVTYIDLLAERTLEAKKLADLRAKRQVTGSVLGDNHEALRTWLLEALSE